MAAAVSDNRGLALLPPTPSSTPSPAAPFQARSFAAANNFPPSAKIYGSYEDLLDDPAVDAVYLPLPSSLYLKWAILAASHNKHVLLEKPIALSVAEFDRIVEACELRGVQFMDGTMWMHHPRTAKMAEFLTDERRFGTH